MTACNIDGCEAQARGRGWCGKHYARWYRHGSAEQKLNQSHEFTECQINDCAGAVYGHGYCAKHYQRWYKHGDPTIVKFLTHQPTTTYYSPGLPEECWPWEGNVTTEGYGRYESGGIVMPAHRAVFESVHGPVPEGMVLDHVCHLPSSCRGGPGCQHRRCVNPDHLAVVTPAENASATRMSRHHCPGCRCFD